MGLQNKTNEEKISIVTKATRGRLSITGYKGVYKQPKGNSYKAIINFSVSKKLIQKNIGNYSTAIEASEARTKYILSLI